MTSFFRLNDDMISVDGVLCQRNEYDDRYYPVREDLYDVSLFPDAIDLFLDLEDRLNREAFNEGLTDLLLNEGINPYYARNK